MVVDDNYLAEHYCPQTYTYALAFLQQVDTVSLSSLLFDVDVEERKDTYVIEIPKRELQLGSLTAGETYRVALLPSTTASDSSPSPTTEQTQTESGPPVEEGDTREVEIETIGDAGDGIARVDHGFVIIIPDTDLGERVRIEITDVRENVAFADVTERIDYYE